MTVGHNNPPDMTQTAAEVSAAVSGFMRDNPVLETEEQAREAKTFIDRSKLCIKDLEAERDGLVRPLNEEVASINDRYRPSRQILGKILDELQRRLAGFLKRKKEELDRAAKEAERAAEEAARVATELQSRERDGIDQAGSGVLDIDIGEAIASTEGAFREAEKAARQAALAKREAENVKVGGGISRAIGLKNKEEIFVLDAGLAIKYLGLTENIKAAIIKDARAYRRLRGSWPPGVSVRTERTV